ncbi:Uncharacterised protein [Burkholderia pseudomallei]|nr:Uncharacterised protein [Burkholderia pseudomallei]
MREPVVLQRIDIGVHRADLIARVGKQLEHADEHAVVAQQHLVGNRLAQRHDLVAIVLRDVVARHVRRVRFAHFGARVDRRLREPVRRLQVGRLRARDFRAAPVEQRNLDADLVAVLVPLVGLVVVEVAEFERVDEARRLREPERARDALRPQLRGPDVEAVVHREALDVVEPRPFGRQLRQALGQFIAGRRAPQPHRARELLACGDRAQPRVRELRDRVRVERLLARVIEPAEVAGAPHPERELRAGVRRILHLLRVSRRLRGGDRLDVRAARVGRDLQHRVGGLELGLLEAPPLDLRRERQRQHAQDTHRERAADAQVVARMRAAEREAGVRQPSRLHEIGLGQAELRIRSLQAAVVQQRDLNRVVDAERLRQQRLRATRHGIAIGVGLHQHRVLAEPLGGRARHGAEAAVPRECRAARGERQYGRRRADPEGNEARRHSAPPCIAPWPCAPAAAPPSAPAGAAAAWRGRGATSRFSCGQFGPSSSR